MTTHHGQPAGNRLSRRTVARLVRIDSRRLRRYEEFGLIQPIVAESGELQYEESQLARLRRIQRLIDHCGLNLAGVEVVMRLTEQLEVLRRQADAEIAELRRRLAGD